MISSVFVDMVFPCDALAVTYKFAAFRQVVERGASASTKGEATW